MLVVARYNEDISWVKGEHFIVQKGEHLPNKGRETSSYLWWIIENYNNLPDTVHFLQGNPFDHTDIYLNSIHKHTTDRFGRPDHNGLRIQEIANELGIELPARWDFYAGANFKLIREQIQSKSLDWYKKAYQISMEHEQAPWIFERLWVLIYN